MEFWSLGEFDVLLGDNLVTPPSLWLVLAQSLDPPSSICGLRFQILLMLQFFLIEV